MPYLLMFLGVLVFGYGFWMLQNQKPKPEPTQTEQVKAPEKKAELTNHEKGLAFEKFVVSRFNKEVFALKQWQGDKFHNGRFAEANQHPDLLLEFHLKDTKAQFAVECKWKAHLPEEHHWAEDRQIENYRKFADETKLPVFVVLGFGGEPSEPAEVYILPLEKLKHSKVKKHYLNEFKREKAGQGFFYEAEKGVLR